MANTQRACTYCGSRGHYISTCALKQEADAEKRREERRTQRKGSPHCLWFERWGGNNCVEQWPASSELRDKNGRRVAWCEFCVEYATQVA